MLDKLGRNNHKTQSISCNASYDSTLLKQSLSIERKSQKSHIKAHNDYLMPTNDVQHSAIAKEAYKREIVTQIKEREHSIKAYKQKQKETQPGFFPNGSDQHKQKFAKFYSKQRNNNNPIIKNDKKEENNGILMLPTMKEQTRQMLHGIYYETPKNHIAANYRTLSVESLGTEHHDQKWKEDNKKLYHDNIVIQTKLKKQTAKSEILKKEDDKTSVLKAAQDQKDIELGKKQIANRIKEEKQKEIEQMEFNKRQTLQQRKLQEQAKLKQIQADRAILIKEEKTKWKNHINDMRNYSSVLEGQVKTSTKSLKNKIEF